MLDERKSIFADIFISKKGIFYKLHTDTYTTIHLPIHIVVDLRSQIIVIFWKNKCVHILEKVSWFVKKIFFLSCIIQINRMADLQVRTKNQHLSFYYIDIFLSTRINFFLALNAFWGHLLDGFYFLVFQKKPT